MVFFSSLKHAANPKPAPPKADKFSEVLHAAMAVAAEFGSTLAAPPSPLDGFGPLQSEKRLPFPKQTIDTALNFLLNTLKSEDARAAAIRSLTPEQAQQFLSERNRQALEAARVCLNNYVTDEALQEQRDVVESILGFVEDLGPDQKAQLLQVPNMKAMLESVTAEATPSRPKPADNSAEIKAQAEAWSKQRGW